MVCCAQGLWSELSPGPEANPLPYAMMQLHPQNMKLWHCPPAASKFPGPAGCWGCWEVVLCPPHDHSLPVVAGHLGWSCLPRGPSLPSVPGSLKV